MKKLQLPRFPPLLLVVEPQASLGIVILNLALTPQFAALLVTN